MDPQNLVFNPHNDPWRIHNDMLRIQQVQSEHGERLSRLERRQEDDARLKSVWGTSSPFPSVLGGTPQQVPLQHPPNEPFSNFDDDQSNLLGSLHLDPQDEPRRIGATSRANSVRFDESANQGWAHASRSSIDLVPRTGSGLGGHAMSERTYSHKSDGRQSSAGQSVHSATSGRANSLGLDTGYGSHPNVSPLGTPGLAPGLFILGSVPAIIRCWLNTNFKHDSLLYAVVCAGSYTSCLDMNIIQDLGFQDLIERDSEGIRKIKLSVYLPEAIQHPASSRSASPAPQIPSFSVNFTIVETADQQSESKAIQIFLGSDVLRAHNADILFSSNTMTMFDDERVKLSIPLVRPENERTFNTLGVSNGFLNDTRHQASEPIVGAPTEATLQRDAVGHKASQSADVERDVTRTSSDEGLANTSASSQQSLEQRHIPGLISTKTDPRDLGDSGLSSSNSRTSPAIWSNWRRDNSEKSSANSAMDWAGASKGATAPSYQRRDTGIKVLKPVKSITRAASSTPLQVGSPSINQSRFFDDGKRRTSAASTADSASEASVKRAVSVETKPGNASISTKDNNGPATAKTRATNPIGGASAFGWLKSEDQAK